MPKADRKANCPGRWRKFSLARGSSISTRKSFTSGVRALASWMRAGRGRKGLSGSTGYPASYPLHFGGHLPDVYVHRAGAHAAAAAGTLHLAFELGGVVEELVEEALAEPSPLGGAGVIAPCQTGKASCLTAFPAPHPLYPPFESIVPDIKTVAAGADIGTEVAVDPPVCQALPVAISEGVPGHLGDTGKGNRGGYRGWGVIYFQLLHIEAGEEGGPPGGAHLEDVALGGGDEQDIQMGGVLGPPAHTLAEALRPGPAAGQAYQGGGLPPPLVMEVGGRGEERDIHKGYAVGITGVQAKEDLLFYFRQGPGLPAPTLALKGEKGL